MKNLLTLILFLSLFFTREHIAVIDFEGINVSEAEAKALTQKLTTELIKVGEYVVLERSEMKKVLDEQKFQYSGCVDTKCAVEIGMMLGAKFIVVGSVSKVGSTYSIDSRLINVKTGESYQSAEFVHKGEIDYLLTEGMKSVAYQLCDIEYQVKQSTSIKVEIDEKPIVKGILPAQVDAIRILAKGEGFNGKGLNLYLNQNYNCSINELTHQQATELINKFQSDKTPNDNLYDGKKYYGNKPQYMIDLMDSQLIGNQNAKVTIIKWLDFQ
jgi:TolB-like protein